MSTTQAGFGTNAPQPNNQPNPQPGPQPTPTPPNNTVADLEKNAREALEAYLNSISNNIQRDKYRRFFEALEKAQKNFVDFPTPMGTDYPSHLDGWINSCAIRKRYMVGVSLLDIKGDLEIGDSFAKLKKGGTLTPENARSLAMAIYLNPKARNGVSTTGTPAERQLLEAALDEINALNPGAHQVKLLNRLTPDPALANANPTPPNPPPGSGPVPPTPPPGGGRPVPDGHHPKMDLGPAEPTLKDKMLADIYPHDKHVANKIWDGLKERLAADARITEPQIDLDTADADAFTAHHADMQNYNEAVKGYWDDNSHLQTEMIKNAGGAIPMPDETKPAPTTANPNIGDTIAPVVDISDDELMSSFGSDASIQPTPPAATRESVSAYIHHKPDVAAAAYDFLNDVLVKHNQKNNIEKTPTPTDIEKAWNETTPEIRDSIIRKVVNSLEAHKVQAESTAPAIDPVDVDIDATPTPAEPSAMAADRSAQPPTACAANPPAASKDTPSFVAPATAHSDSAQAPAKVKKSFTNGARHTNGNGAEKKPAATGIDDEIMRNARIYVIGEKDTTLKGMQKAVGVGATRARRIFDRLEDEGVVGQPEASGRRSIPAQDHGGKKGGTHMRHDIH